MYVVTIRNLTRKDIFLLGVNRREGKVPPQIEVVVTLTEEEWATAKPGLDVQVTNGDVLYWVIREGFGQILVSIDLGELASDADLEQDFPLADRIPAGAHIFAASLRLDETADGGATTAAECDIILSAPQTFTLFSVPFEIHEDNGAQVTDNAQADQNLRPLPTDVIPLLRVTATGGNMETLDQGIVQASILYFNPSLA